MEEIISAEFSEHPEWDPLERSYLCSSGWSQNSQMPDRSCFCAETEPYPLERTCGRVLQKIRNLFLIVSKLLVLILIKLDNIKNVPMAI